MTPRPVLFSEEAASMLLSQFGSNLDRLTAFRIGLSLVGRGVPGGGSVSVTVDTVAASIRVVSRRPSPKSNLRISRRRG